VTLIDTARVYGFGRSEEIVGKTLAEGSLRDKVRIASKVGLAWKEGAIFRDSRVARRRLKDFHLFVNTEDLRHFNFTLGVAALKIATRLVGLDRLGAEDLANRALSQIGRRGRMT
jgi:hypothetical protein